MPRVRVLRSSSWKASLGTVTATPYSRRATRPPEEQLVKWLAAGQLAPASWRG